MFEIENLETRKSFSAAPRGSRSSADLLEGDAGNDTIHSGVGPDTVDGGADTDTLVEGDRGTAPKHLTIASDKPEFISADGAVNVITASNG